MEYCTFKGNRCKISSPSSKLCTKGDEGWCAMAETIIKKEEIAMKILSEKIRREDLIEVCCRCNKIHIGNNGDGWRYPIAEEVSTILSRIEEWHGKGVVCPDHNSNKT